MTVTTNKLPEKLSDLIELALADLEKVEKNWRYKVNMSKWHRPIWNKWYLPNMCEVCFAGAVMAGTLGVDINENIDVRGFNDYIHYRLRALDSLRVGDVEGALEYLRMRQPPVGTIDVTPYEESPLLFRKDLEKIVVYLRKHNL